MHGKRSHNLLRMREIKHLPVPYVRVFVTVPTNKKRAIHYKNVMQTSSLQLYIIGCTRAHSSGNKVVGYP